MAALFVLMGCGMGSKVNQEMGGSLQPQGNLSEEIIYTLITGNYSGTLGEVYVADAKPEDIQKLLDGRKLNEELASLQKKIDGVTAEDQTTVVADVQKDIDLHSEALKSFDMNELEKLVDFRLSSMNFSISQDEKDSNVYHMNDLNIKTSLDKPAVIAEDGTVVTEAEYKFGNIASTDVKFDSKTGFSFSFTLGEGESALLYTFKGIPSDKILKGTIEVSIKDEIHQGGNFEVSLIEEPKAEEAAPVVPATEEITPDSPDTSK